MKGRNNVRYFDLEQVRAQKQKEHALRSTYAEALDCIDRELRKLAKVRQDAKKADIAFGKLLETLLPAGTIIKYRFAPRIKRECEILDWNPDHTFCITYDKTGRVKENATLDRIISIVRRIDV